MITGSHICGFEDIGFQTTVAKIGGSHGHELNEGGNARRKNKFANKLRRNMKLLEILGMESKLGMREESLEAWLQSGNMGG